MMAESDVYKPYEKVPFEKLHKNIYGKKIYPLGCMQWLMASIDDRKKALNGPVNLVCRICLKMSGMDSAASGKTCKNNKNLKKSLHG